MASRQTAINGRGDLFPHLRDGGRAEAVRVGVDALSNSELAAAAGAVAERVQGMGCVAVWAEPVLETVISVVGGLIAGVPVVPLNPQAGAGELDHVLDDASPAALLHRPGAAVPTGFPMRIAVDREARGRVAAETAPESPGLIVYTSGTTGPPKGVVLSRRALMSNLDALAEAWRWTAADTVVHGLPLFHVHGLVLGILGPIRLGGRVHHVGRWSPAVTASALEAGGTMLFAVPTMYHRLAQEAAGQPGLAAALRRARLLVSGSAPLAAADHEGVEQATGQRILERYGLTETLMVTAVRDGAPPRPGSVGQPLAGVEIRLLDDNRRVIGGVATEAVGEIAVRGASLFSGYLNQAEATAASMADGWFMTGDIGVLDDGWLRVLGRKSTDLIKTGGYRVGAGEVESVLLDHPAVAEVAVAGTPDPDLGERISAWVVTQPGMRTSAEELIAHVADRLAPHKRPRRVEFVTQLPRNHMGKVLKRELTREEAPIDPSR